MSYILDALKKSEKERAMGTIPTLHSTETERGRKVPLSWFVGVLSIAALAFALYTLRSFWMKPTEAVVKMRPDTATVPNPRPDPALDAGAESVDPGGSMTATPAENEESEVMPNPPAAPETSDALLKMAELDPSIRNRMPQLSINVLSYSRNEDKRFVMIDQNIYKQGQDMGNGVVIEEIRKSDVVLSFEGVRFILLP